MTGTEIGELVIGAVVAVMGYFVKVLHNDVRQNTKETGENKGAIDSLNIRIEHESEMRNTSYNNLLAILSEIKEDIKNLKNK